MIRTLGRYVLERTHLYGLYSLHVKGPLLEDGWFRSFEEQRVIDHRGNPVPFLTYPAVEFLLRRVRPEMSVFEYGAGASTLWWARHVREVIACEHNRRWFEGISAQAPPNVTLIYRELEYGGAYSKAILEYHNRFDIVVIDGRDRVNCALNSLVALKAAGVLMWDNTDRREYEPGLRHLRRAGFRELEFIGMCPMINEKSRTSIFYRTANCLGI